jgi:hypothetical protein
MTAADESRRIGRSRRPVKEEVMETAAAGRCNVLSRSQQTFCSKEDNMLLTILLIALVWSLVPLFICSSLAGRKGKSRGLWVFLGLIFGWLAVLVIAVSSSEK